MSWSPQSTRRRLLSALTVTGSIALSGCSAVTGLFGESDAKSGPHGATDVVAVNVGSERKRVSMTITDAGDGSRHTARTLQLDPAERADPVNDGKLPTNGEYTVEADVEDGPRETFEWDDPELARAPLWVLVDDSENVRFLLQAG
ncbi:hypothetical protein [Halostella litorea]|uniref:hypothetical protein n=1 Tax=Halostella litorea TaxID=2528831 RepID=UPI001091903C|nr:hypothetical protein [Halostella litorea]